MPKITKKLTFADVGAEHLNLEFIIVTPYTTIDTSLYNQIVLKSDSGTAVLELTKNIDPLHAVTTVVKESDCKYIQIKQVVGHLKSGSPIKGGYN